MAAATKHHAPSVSDDEHIPPNCKRPKIDSASVKVGLNPADSNLDFTVGEDGLAGSALHGEGFAYCWSGSRANLGVKGGRYCFACKVVAAQPVVMEDTPKDQQNLCRLGISRGDDDVGSLGESKHSFGYGGTGKFSYNGMFTDYGGKFNVGDTIVCAVDLESKPFAKIAFAKNGVWLGTAKVFTVGPSESGATYAESSGKTQDKDAGRIPHIPLISGGWDGALFPHVLLKNVVIQMQFSIMDGLVPLQGFKPWDTAFQDGNGVQGPRLGNVHDCEVVMMVGLPAAGKTTWAVQWATEHPEKRYMILGTNLALDQMKVPGLMRKRNYGERFDRLMDRATKIFNKLIERAASTPRNYILDQTNVYRSARLRKLKAFRCFRKIAVVIFPTPENLKQRTVTRTQEMGKEVPADAVNEMLANFVLPRAKDMPSSIEPFDEVWFPELKQEEAEVVLDKMKSAISTRPSNKLESNTPTQSYQGSSWDRYSRESSIGAGLSRPYMAGTQVPYGVEQGLGGYFRQSVSEQPSYTGTPVGHGYSSFNSPQGPTSDLPGHPKARLYDDYQYIPSYQERNYRSSGLQSMESIYSSHLLDIDRPNHSSHLLSTDRSNHYLGHHERAPVDSPYRVGDPRSLTANLQAPALSYVGGPLGERTPDLIHTQAWQSPVGTSERHQPSWQGPSVGQPYLSPSAKGPSYAVPSMQSPQQGGGPRYY